MMETITEFLLPGATTALVFYILIMSVPFRNLLLEYHAYVDVTFTFVLLWVLNGTFSGAMTASIGGVTLSLMLIVSKWLFLPYEVQYEDNSHIPRQRHAR